MTQPILVILQKENSSPGRLGTLLLAMGYALDVRVPGSGESLPKTLEEHGAVVTFGGPMSVNDVESQPFIRRQLQWIPTALASGKPFLGICMGAQLLARALGARVARHPEGLSEIGYYRVQPTPAAGGFLEDPLYVYHWHSEGFELPRGAELLARGEIFPHQAFRYGPTTLGLQFHPEVTAEVVRRWTGTAGERLAVAGAQSRKEQLRGIERHDNALATWSETFLTWWLAGTGASLAVDRGEGPAGIRMRR